MKDLLQKSIDQLRNHVLQNLEKVRENEKEIRELLKSPATDTRTNILNVKYDISRKLLTENNDFINMQLSILNFINKYRQIIVPVEELETVHQSITKEALTKEECFQMTIESRIEFGPLHPFFADNAFISELLGYYQQIEDYEKCAEIMKIRK